MRFSLCNEVIAEKSFEEQCVFAASLGYEGIEIAPFTICDDPRDVDDAEIRKTRNALSGAGIVASGLHWLLLTPTGLSITSEDTSIRENTEAVIEANIRLCAEIGGTVLVHGSPAQRMLGQDEAGARGRAIDMLGKAASYAEAANVTYCIEPLRSVETDFLNSVSEAVTIVEEIGSANFKTMIDTSAAASMEDISVSEAIRRWMPSGHIAHIQFNDANRRAAGQGEDRFLDVLKALKETGYDGFIAMEPFDYQPDGPATAAYTLGYVTGLMEALQ